MNLFTDNTLFMPAKRKAAAKRPARKAAPKRKAAARKPAKRKAAKKRK